MRCDNISRLIFIYSYYITCSIFKNVHSSLTVKSNSEYRSKSFSPHTDLSIHRDFINLTAAVNDGKRIQITHVEVAIYKAKGGWNNMTFECRNINYAFNLSVTCYPDQLSVIRL